MQLTCTCGYIAKSLIIGDNEKALGEVLMFFSKHIVERHKDFHVELIKSLKVLTQIGITIAMVAKHSTLLDLPPEETLAEGGESTFIMENFSELTDQLQEALGIEVFDSRPEEEEEEDDDEDEDELDDTEEETESLPESPIMKL